MARTVHQHINAAPLTHGEIDEPLEVFIRLVGAVDAEPAQFWRSGTGAPAPSVSLLLRRIAGAV